MAPARQSAGTSVQATPKAVDSCGSEVEAEPTHEADPGTNPAGNPGPAPHRLGRIIDRYLWIWLSGLAGLDFAAIWTFLPHVREDVTLFDFVIKVSAFVLAVLAVAMFPQRFRMAYLLLSVPSLIFLGFIIPRMMWLFLQGPHTEPEYYTYLWSLQYPGIVLSIALAYRIGGGSSGGVVKVGLNGIILVFSGYLELMWFIVNDWNYYDLPSIPHVEVILGFFPSYGQLFVFALCHIPFIVLVIMAPFDRWLEQWRARIYGDAPRPEASVLAPKGS